MPLFLQIFLQFLFWIYFFCINRLIFLSYHYDKLKGLAPGEIFSAFYHGLYLDVSAACYLLVLPFLLGFFQLFFRNKFFVQLCRYYSFLMIAVISIIVSAELGVYDEWKTKLHAKALLYLQHPSEIFNSAPLPVILSGIFFILLQSFGGIYLYNKFIYPFSNNNSISGSLTPVWRAATGLLLPGLIFLGIRGGWQPIPIHQSDVYFSRNNFLNTAAVNSCWNLIQSIEQNKKNLNTNPYRFFSEEESKKIVNDLYTIKKDTTEKIIENERPNVVLFILEGWAADVIESLNGEKGIAPEFEKLIEEGVLFTNCYSSGERSEQGMAAILSGFPAQPNTSVIGQPSKYPRLPSVNASFLKEGYVTSFLFGGQLNYGNIKGFIYYSGFDKIIEGADFPDNIPQQRLGVPDEFLFERNLRELEKERQPFFSVMYTLSSHAPYDQPMEDVIHKGGEHQKYLNSVYYSDRSIGEFFEEARAQGWYKNTLFVLVADHSHPSPANRDFYEPAYKKIPLLFYGDVIKKTYRGKKNEKVISQVDIAATLLGQLGLQHEEFKWSKDALNPYSPEFAYYTFFTDGFGWIEKDGFVVYRKDTEDVYLFNGDEKQKGQLTNRGKAFLQALFGEYLAY